MRPAIRTATPSGAGATADNRTWADIGAGSGAFTLALAELLGPGAQLIAVDRDRRALDENVRTLNDLFRDTTLTTVVADFRAPLDLPPLDGLIAANSLHFVPSAQRLAVIAQLAALLRPGGTFVVVEYDADTGNAWVPHPFSSSRWSTLAEAAGLVEPGIIGRVPSRFLDAIYSASAQRSRD